MKHLFIIFSENGRLYDYCRTLIDKTNYRDILSDKELCFLNGKSCHIPFHQHELEIDSDGVLLIYDAHENSTYDKSDTLEALQRISKKYSNLYICYHANTDSHEKWEKAISAININFSKKPIVKHHTEEPYKFLLHEFHAGTKTIEDLIDFWHNEEQKEEIKQKCFDRRQLIYAIDESYRTNNANYLETPTIYKLVIACTFNEVELKEFISLKKLIKKREIEEKWNNTSRNFMNLILSGC